MGPMNAAEALDVMRREAAILSRPLDSYPFEQRADRARAKQVHRARLAEAAMDYLRFVDEDGAR